MRIALVIFFLWNACNSYSQDKAIDSLKIEKKAVKKHSPRTAAILSAAIPGAGQVYNRKYWKPPIIYVALGGFGYYFLKNQKQYTYYHESLVKAVAGDSSVIVSTGNSIDQLAANKLIYRKHRDMFGFALIAVYAINIIDANVDAHLMSFDISDDLSLQINAKPLLFPSLNGISCAAGLSFKLNFK